MTLTCRPFWSEYATNLPSGEIAPSSTEFSNELRVSCGRIGCLTDEDKNRGCLANQKIPLAIIPMPPTPAATERHREEPFGTLSCFKFSKSTCISDAVW